MTVHDRVIIGSGTEIGPGVMIFDHDHDVKEYSLKQNHYITDEIVIGENVWIGANVTILRGSHIGDNSIVGAGAVLKGNYPENCLIIQKRETKQVILDMNGEK